MKRNQYLLLILLAVLVASCGSKRKVVTTRKKSKPKTEVVIDDLDKGEENRQTPAEVEDEIRDNTSHRSYNNLVEDYIRTYAPIAQEEMKLYDIPASITLAQGILESGAGEGELCRIANNHFGIKCHEWSGAKVYHDDDARGECFRKYKDPKYSFRDHSLFLSGKGRYAFLFDLDEDDYKGWARGLRKAGYATDRRYPDKLIGLIERYELYRYDSDVLKKPSPTYTSSAEKGKDTYVVQKGDTLYSIAKRYNTTVEKLQRYNGMNGTNLAIGQLLYIVSPTE